MTALSEKGFSPSEIQTVTGRKRIETIEKYTKRISSSKKMKLSHALSSGLDYSRAEIPECCSASVLCERNTLKITRNERQTRNESESEK